MYILFDMLIRQINTFGTWFLFIIIIIIIIIIYETYIDHLKKSFCSFSGAIFLHNIYFDLLIFWQHCRHRKIGKIGHQSDKLSYLLKIQLFTH